MALVEAHAERHRRRQNRIELLGDAARHDARGKRVRAHGPVLAVLLGRTQRQNDDAGACFDVVLDFVEGHAIEFT